MTVSFVWKINTLTSFTSTQFQ